MIRDNDISADAASAYAEVMERTSQELTAPRAPVAREPAAAPEKRVQEPVVTKPVEKAVETKTVEKPVAKVTEKPTDDKRDERGRFAAKPAGKGPDDGKAAEVEDPKAVAAAEGDDKGPAETEVKETAAAEVKGGPPSSFSIKSKAAWDALPEHVRSDILKREGDAASGLKALQDYKDLKPYAERAAREGTTIKGALDHYVKMEDVLRKDMGFGFATIAQNFGMSQEKAAQFFATLAKKLGGPAVAVGSGATADPAPAADPLMDALKPIFDPINKRLDEMGSQLGGRAKQDQEAQLQNLTAAIADFAAKPENIYYANLEESMYSLMEKGVVKVDPNNFAATLREAYDLAARMNPEISEALIEKRLQESREATRKAEQEAADKAKAASRSTTGTGTPSLKVQDTKRPVTGANRHADIEADARAAYRLHANAS